MRKLLGSVALLLAGLVSSNALADAVPVGNHTITANLTNSFTTLIDPASNTEGVFLRTCTIISQAPAGQPSIAFIATGTTSASPTILVANAEPSTMVQESLPYELFLRAGTGLYGFASSGTSPAINGTLFCSYDIQN